jgi:hypothetical protein
VSYRLSSKRTRHLVVLGKAGRFLSIPDHFGPFLVSTTDAHEDYFWADRAWFYIVLLSIGYMVSRGLARAGTASTTTLNQPAGQAQTPSRVWPPPRLLRSGFDEHKRDNGQAASTAARSRRRHMRITPDMRAE